MHILLPPKFTKQNFVVNYIGEFPILCLMHCLNSSSVIMFV
jgi:hypothetical protein